MIRTRSTVAALLGVALAASASAQEPRTFALRFKDRDGKAVPFYQEMTTAVDQRIKVQGQDLPQSQKSTFYYAWTPLKEDAGRWTVKQKIEAVKMKIDIAGNPVTFDSTKPDEPTGNASLTDFFKGLVGAEFVVTLTPAYRVERIEGKEAFIKKLGSSAPQMDALLKKVMSDEAMKEMCDPTFGLLPDAPRKIGDRWDRKKSINLGPIGSYDVTYRFTFVSPDPARPGLDKIEVTADLNYVAPKEKPDPKDGVVFRIKPESKMATDPTGSKGVVYYNPARQRIEEASIAIKLKGDLKVEIGGTDTTVELVQEQTTTIKTRGISFLAPPGTVEPPVPADPPASGPGAGPGPGATVGVAPACVPLCCEPPRERRLFARFPLRPCFPVRQR